MSGSSVFAIVCFAALLALEEAMRGDHASVSEWSRVSTNWGLGAVNFGLAALLPLTTMLTAIWSGPGLLASWPPLASFIALLAARSFAAYWFHRSLHASPLLWRMHKVHHTDTLIDCSTGLRNHPFESLIATPLAAAIVIALGPSVGMVAAVNAVLLAASFWHHAAIRLPPKVSRILEWLLVTPRLHLVHHSQERAKHDSNFGDIVVIWDRAFGSFAKPESGSVAVGLKGENQHAQSFLHQLASPFRR